MKDHDKSVRWFALIAALGAIFMSSGSVFAAPPLPRFEVWVDGKPALRSFGGKRGVDADTLWRYLKNAEFDPTVTDQRNFKSYAVEPDADDSLRATLKGKVIVYVEEGGRADVSELKLIRKDENARWMLVPGEVDRTLRIRHKPFSIVVSVDGRPELSTGIVTRTGNSLDSPDNVWQQLKRLYVIPIRGQIQTNEEDSLHATLRGNVVIELKYDRQPWGRAEVSTLKLFRQNAKARRWQVDPADVDRTFGSRTETPAGGNAANDTSNDTAKGGVSSSPKGTWNWSAGKTQMTLRLKQEGQELTGVIIANNATQTPIEDGRYDDGRISFKVSRQDGQATITAEYAGTVSENTINGGYRVYIGPRPKTMPARPVPWQAQRTEE